MFLDEFAKAFVATFLSLSAIKIIQGVLLLFAIYKVNDFSLSIQIENFCPLNLFLHFLA